VARFAAAVVVAYRLHAEPGRGREISFTLASGAIFGAGLLGGAWAGGRVLRKLA
jgi:hypothetical protein